MCIRDRSNIIQDQVLDLIRSLSVENSDASIKEFWANENLRLIEKFIENNYGQGNKEKVLELIEENKSNILARDINQDILKGYANVPVKLIARGDSLERELNILRRSRSELVNKTVTGDSEQLNALINKLQAALDTYKKNVDVSYPEFLSLIHI